MKHEDREGETEICDMHTANTFHRLEPCVCVHTHEDVRMCAAKCTCDSRVCVQAASSVILCDTAESTQKKKCQFSSVIGMLPGSARSGTFMLYGETVGGWSPAARAPKVASPSFLDHVKQSLSVSEEASGAKCGRR